MTLMRTKLMAGAALVSCLYPQFAAAQTPDGSNTANIEQIEVTGTAIVREGYQAPTPVTTLNVQDIQQQAPGNIADLVTLLPAVSGSSTNQNSNQNFSNGQVGIVAMNLRSLGTSRTLVLIDGRRSVSSAITGVVDVDTFPQQLVKRVDVVTGGASAVYGSDAIAGVVNFVLDKTYTGIKGEVSGGVTAYGDDTSEKIALTAGLPFASGHGHLLLSGGWDHGDGIFGNTRKWNSTGTHVFLNPNYTATNGQPERLIEPHSQFNTATAGGIITSGPLAGTAFGPGGTPYQFDYGTLKSSTISVGGDWQANQANQGDSLDQQQKRENLFSRLSYNITDDIEFYVEGSYSQAHTVAWDVDDFSFANLTLSATNPFLPASVAARAAAAKVTTLTMGSFWGDEPPITFVGNRATTRVVAGTDGSLKAFGTTWTWDAYAQWGFNASSENGYSINTANQKLALDAVISPTTGAIVCRSTLTAPTNGCQPYNIFGTGVNSQPAIDYLGGASQADNDSYRHEGFTQTALSATIQGEPFSDWAGPISVALGVQSRREAIKGVADAQSAAHNWYSGNYLPTNGSFNVTEGFIETVVPLLQDLDVNAAVRETGYSTSGLVTTYKIGVEYMPVPDIRLRATRSRDIRAPNLNDLYAAGTAGTNNLTDPFLNNKTYSYLTITSGNPDLKPETADTTELGVVATPSFLPGLSASVDYWDIQLANGIGSVGATTTLSNCFAGQAQYCSAIVRDPSTGLITIIYNTSFNLQSARATGIDIETSYAAPMSDFIPEANGDLTFHGLVTHYLHSKSNNGLGTLHESVGLNDSLNSNTTSGPPDWVYRGTVTYSNAPYTLSFTGRGISAGVYSQNGYAFVGCRSACPTSTATAPTINDNHVPGSIYWDASGSYDFGRFQFFLAVRNILNTDPPILPSATGVPNLSQTNLTLFDILGRTYRGGVRFNF